MPKNTKQKPKAKASRNTASPEPFRFMDLPAELRVEVYGYILVEDQPVSIKALRRYRGVCEVVRQDSHRHSHNRARRGQVPLKQHEWIAAPPNYTSILFTSQQVYQEAFQVLYGANSFRFCSTTALREFIELAGSLAAHLRVVYIGPGWDRTSSGYVKSSAQRAFKALRVAKSLRTLQIDHVDVCHGFSRPGKPRISASRIVHDTLPLLRVLKTSYEQQSVAWTVLDVLQFDLTPPAKCLTCGQGYEDNHCLVYQRCPCSCRNGKAVSQAVQANVRSLVAQKLKIQE